MPSSRPMAGARSRHLLFAAVLVVMAGGKGAVAGDQKPPGSNEARVEINGGPNKTDRVAAVPARKKTGRVEIDLGGSKDVAMELKPPRRKSGLVEIDLGDSKDATVEIVRDRKGAAIEINGFRFHPHFKTGRRYLFGQEQAEMDPPLPPSEFNPDPGGGNLLEPEEPPDLYPPILPQPPEYTD